MKKMLLVALVILLSFFMVSSASAWTLIWDSSETNGEGTNIYYHMIDSSEDVQSIDAKDKSKYDVELMNLVKNVRYEFWCTAYNDFLESDHSNHLKWTYPGYDLIPQSQLSVVSVDSEELEAVYKPAENVIDGITSTFWHTEWYRSDPDCPHEIVIDLGDLYVVGGFQYLPRQDGNINGTVADYNIYVSKDGIIWGEAVATGTFAGDTTEKKVTFTGKRGRYVCFVAMSEVNGNPWTTAAEINVLGSVLYVDFDADGISDDNEIDIYGTNPNDSDTDGDSINDGDELAFWGDDWNLDIDNDGIINILDYDADGDGVSDGEEVELGFDPSDPDSNPNKILNAPIDLTIQL